jgi:hypothetical protein
MASGILLGESLRVGAVLDSVPLIMDSISRADAGDESVGQPRTWTYINFTVADEEAARLADALSSALNAVGGWYCDYRTAGETFVVFANRVFRYSRGDQGGRREVQDYALAVGVPESQLDWPE